MAKNDNPQEARRAQDVDVPGIILPEGTHHTGRGTSSQRLALRESRKTSLTDL